MDNRTFFGQYDHISISLLSLSLSNTTVFLQYHTSNSISAKSRTHSAIISPQQPDSTKQNPATPQSKTWHRQTHHYTTPKATRLYTIIMQSSKIQVSASKTAGKAATRISSPSPPTPGLPPRQLTTSDVQTTRHNRPHHYSPSSHQRSRT